MSKLIEQYKAEIKSLERRLERMEARYRELKRQNDYYLGTKNSESIAFIPSLNELLMDFDEYLRKQYPRFPTIHRRYKSNIRELVNLRKIFVLVATKYGYTTNPISQTLGYTSHSMAVVHKASGNDLLALDETFKALYKEMVCFLSDKYESKSADAKRPGIDTKSVLSVGDDQQVSSGDAGIDDEDGSALLSPEQLCEPIGVD